MQTLAFLINRALIIVCTSYNALTIQYRVVFLLYADLLLILCVCALERRFQVRWIVVDVVGTSRWQVRLVPSCQNDL